MILSRHDSVPPSAFSSVPAVKIRENSCNSCLLSPSIRVHPCPSVGKSPLGAAPLLCVFPLFLRCFVVQFLIFLPLLFSSVLVLNSHAAALETREGGIIRGPASARRIAL